MTLGEKVKFARKQAGLSQEQLAGKLGVSRSAVAKWEANNGIPDIDNLKILSHLLGVTIDELVNDSVSFDKIAADDLSGHCNNYLADEGESFSPQEEICPAKDTADRHKTKLLAASIVVCILCAAGFFWRVMFYNAAAKEAQFYTVTSEINSLCVNINAADITLRQGEAFSVESNVKHLTVKDEGGLLSIKDTKKFFANYNNATLIITIPIDTVFESAELKTGAGRFSVDTLSAKTLDCDFGAGEVKIGSLSVSSSAEIDGGAGEITISGGSIHNLDFDMGVGRINLTSLLTGECDLTLGVGESNVTLLGSKDHYTLDISKAIGNIHVDGDNISHAAGLGSGQNKVKLSGGIGTVNVKFQEIDP